MSNELRLSQLKKAWMEIQHLREEQEAQRKISKAAGKRVRQIAQELPKRMDAYTKMMV